MRSSVLTYRRTKQFRCAMESDVAACSMRAAVALLRVMFDCTSNGPSTGLMLLVYERESC